MGHWYAFVDGANFRVLVEATRRYYGLEADNVFDFETAFKNLFPRTSRVFYYDSLPPKKDNQSDQQYLAELASVEKLFKTINSCGGVHVKTGVARHRKGRGVEQKGVDILLALEAFRHAVGGLDMAYLFTSDGDFYPVLEALQGTHARTSLLCNRTFAPDYLVELADFVKFVNESDLIRYFSISHDLRRSTTASAGSFTNGEVQARENHLTRLRTINISSDTLVEVWEDKNSLQIYAMRPDFSFVTAKDERTVAKLMEKEFGYDPAHHGALRG